MNALDRVNEAAAYAENHTQKTWKEQLFELAQTPEGWNNILEVLKEHPGFGALNVMNIAKARINRDLDDTFELLTYEEAGGNVRKGAPAITLYRPKKEKVAGTWENVLDKEGNPVFTKQTVFPRSFCYGLDPHRTSQYKPARLHWDDVQNVEKFRAALELANKQTPMPEYGTVEDYVLAKRYNLTQDVEPVGEVRSFPASVTSPEFFAQRLNEISQNLAKLTKNLEWELFLYDHPEKRQNTLENAKQMLGEHPEIKASTQDEHITEPQNSLNSKNIPPQASAADVMKSAHNASNLANNEKNLTHKTSQKISM